MKKEKKKKEKRNSHYPVQHEIKEAVEIEEKYYNFENS
jgi:hypothetical protein